MYRVQLLRYQRFWFWSMYWLCLWKEQMESFNHWNSNVVMVTTLRLTTSALIVIIETRGAAGSRAWSPWLSFFIPKNSDSTSGNLQQFSSMPFFIVHLYLCLQCLIPYSSSPIICYLVDANLHYVFNHCCVCSSFRVASMPAVRYDLNGGFPTCLWYDSLYIRIIWLLFCLCNLCKPDMVPVSIYVE